MCPKSELCRLCLCASTEVKELVSENGQYNHIYEITAKYFDPLLLTTVICVDCWQHIHEFYEFQQSVLKAQENLEVVEKHEPIVKLEMVLVDQDDKDKKQDEFYIIKQTNYSINEENDNPLLFDSFDSTDNNQFSFDDEMSLSENSTQNISMEEENISIKEESIEPLPHDTIIEDEYKFKCTYCGRTFKFARDLRDHTAIHTGQAFYQCPFCTTKCTLYRNIRRHIQKLHPKEYVEVGYHQHGELKKLYINLNEKPIQSDHEPVPHDTKIEDEYKFKCTYCGKTFKLARDLRDHTAIHTGQAFYQCPFCTTKCTLYRNIRRHIQKLHPKEYIEVGYHQNGELNKLYINLNEKPIQSDQDDDESKFKCPYCRGKVSHGKNLRRHIKTLHPEKFEEYLLEVQNLKLKQEIDNDNDNGYKCPYCHRKFSQKRNINRHIKSVHPEKYVKPNVDVPKVDLNLLGNPAEQNEPIDEDIPNYDDYDAFIAKWREVLECDLCKKTFTNFSLLRKHFKDEHPNEKCHIICCEHKIPSRIRLVDHIRFHLDPNSFKCTKCEKCFPNSIALNLHMKIHDGEKPYQCNICEKSFRKRDKLLLHSGRHSSETNYFCNVCDKGFPTKALLKKHGYIHSRNIKYLCDHCGKCYYSAIDLEKHILQHTDIENPNSKWPCDLCSTSYNSRIALNQHKNTHHSDTVYICSECGKKCSSKLYLKLHKKRVHGSKDTFKCPICNKELVSARSLHDHKATHDGNAEYQCPYCSLKLKQKKNIPRHIQIAHPVKFNEMKKRKRTKVDLSLIDHQIVI